VGLLYHALESLPDAVAITALEPNGQAPRIIYANPAFLDLSHSAGAPRRARFQPAPPGGEDPLEKSLQESHRHEDVYSAEVRCVGRDGSRKLLRLQSEPVRDRSGAVTHRIAVFRDVTVESNLEEALRRNERLACIGLLGAGIAHEINNPAGSALLAAETALALKDTPGAGEQIGACLRNVIASMDRCGRIVRTLLRYSRQEPTERQGCSLNDVVEQAVELARPYAESHGAELRVELDPGVSLAPMNPLEIELVLVNLIRNAIEAGSGGASISIHTARSETHVRAVVGDNGCGMNEEQLAHVFDPLYTTRRQAGGSGLGMSIAQGIVQAHAGRMEVRSRPGAGTIVIVELPTA
jgi:PAS domain S-box-containing protein